MRFDAHTDAVIDGISVAVQMKASMLIVEDDPAAIELTEYLLRAAGYEPWKAMDGLQGLEIIRTWRPRLVLCDLLMPVMDGYEMLQQVRIEPAIKQTTIIAVSALSLPGDKLKALSAGFDGYMPKPIRPESFVDELESFLSAAAC